MQAYVLFGGLEKVRHQALRQPDSLLLQPNLNTTLPILGLVNRGGGDNDCPADLSEIIEGENCDIGDKTCGTCPPDPCQFCNLMRCENGTWIRMEAFPDPNCNADGGGSGDAG